MNKHIIMSDEKPEICEKIRSKYSLIITEPIEELLPFEKRHADMQCLRLDDTFFVLKEAKQLFDKLISLGLNAVKTHKNIDRKYPHNVLLNAVYMNSRLYCKENSVDPNIIEYCKSNGIELVNVNQGYTKCSTALFGDCFITADKGIYDAMTLNGEEGLLIESGDIDLDGVNYGFIGGSSFYDNGIAYFTGDIHKHKNGVEIESFLKSQGIITECLSDNKIYDTGGFIVM